MVGKTFKSKINGIVFEVVGAFTDGYAEYYKVREVATNRTVVTDKLWFENGIMKNLEEVVNDETN